MLFSSGIITAALAALPVLIQPAAADIDYDKRCDQDMAFCLASFIWCETDSDTPTCSYPDKQYPHRSGINVGRAGLLWNEYYTIRWMKTDPNHPVNVRWAVRAPDGYERNDWERSMHPPGTL